MNETLRFLKRFALTALLLLCLTAMACGAALVDANTRFLSQGARGRQVGISLDRETSAFLMDDRAYTLSPLEPLLRYARLAPAPAGTVIALGKELWELTMNN